MSITTTNSAAPEFRVGMALTALANDWASELARAFPFGTDRAAEEIKARAIAGELTIEQARAELEEVNRRACWADRRAKELEAVAHLPAGVHYVGERHGLVIDGQRIRTVDVTRTGEEIGKALDAQAASRFSSSGS